MPQLIASVEGVEIKHLYLQKNRTTLGRKAHNDVVFDNMVVSGEHCVFELSGIADVHIEDLHSTNGTYINNQMIKSRQQLRNNDIISIGNFRIRFLAASEQDQPEAHGATTAMSLSSLDALGFPGTSGTLQASLKLLSGPSEGLEVALVKAVTTFGQTGVAVVSVSHRRDGYYVAHLNGDKPSTLNGKRIGAQAQRMSDHDVLELPGTAMEFLLKQP